MLELERWAQGRFTPMAMLAQMIALSAAECHDLMTDHKRRRKLILNQAKEITLDRWLNLYRNRSWVESIILGLAFNPESTDDLDQTRIEFKAIKQANIAAVREVVTKQLTKGIDERELKFANRLIERYYKQTHIPMMEDELGGSEQVVENLDFWVKQPEILFFLLVAMPCWLEFQVSPWMLYAQARRGNFQSLEQLVRLDSHVDKDPALAEPVFRLMREEPERYNLLQRAGLEGCRGKVDLADVKYLLGGLLMKVSRHWEGILKGELLFTAIEQNIIEGHRDEVMKWMNAARKRAARSSVNCWLKAPDIKKLFDAIAKDSGKGLIDPDFDGEPNSIYKRLERNAKLWPNLWKADKNRAA